MRAFLNVFLSLHGFTGQKDIRKHTTYVSRPTFTKSVPFSMELIMQGLKFWATEQAPNQVNTQAKPKRPAMSCRNETIDYKDFHLCAYDPILKAVLLVGDNAPAIRLSRGRRRTVVPVGSGTHWLDCYVFAGTSSFLLLSPDRLVLFDYILEGFSSSLSPSRDSDYRGLFTSLHVPQGLTWGVVGCRDGCVRYWRLREVDGQLSLAWAALRTDILAFCRPFLTASCGKPGGHIHCIESYHTNPNTFLAVVSSAPGVCKWYVGENRMSRFFIATETSGVGTLARCAVVPDAAYITATTFDISAVYIWAEDGKMKSDRSVAPLWVVKTGSCDVLPSIRASALDGDGSLTFTAASCGMHVARGADETESSNSTVTSDIYILLHSMEDIFELIVSVENKQVVLKDDLRGRISTARVQFGCTADAMETLTVRCVVPCVRSSYWSGAWSMADFNFILVTTDECSPLLLKRSQPGSDVQCATEIRDLAHGPDVWSRMLLIAAPNGVMDTLWRTICSGTDQSDPWFDVVSGVSDGKRANGDCVATDAFIAVTPYMPNGVACLLPNVNDSIPLPAATVKQYLPWLRCSPCIEGNALVLLQESVPEFPGTSEIVIRAFADDERVSVYAAHLSPPKVEHILDLTRTQLLGETGDVSDGEVVAHAARLVDCRLVPLCGETDQFKLLRGGKSLILQLCDNSLLVVDLSSAPGSGGGKPAMIHYPVGLFPAGSTVASFDTVWVSADELPNGVSCKHEEGRTVLLLLCLLSQQKGLVVWNMNQTRLLAYLAGRDIGNWRHNAIMTCRPRDYDRVVAHAIKVTVRLPSDGAHPSTSEGAEGSGKLEGLLSLRDVCGRLLASVCVRYIKASGANSQENWQVKNAAGSAEWIKVIGDELSGELCLHIGISTDEVVVVGVEGEQSVGKLSVSSRHISAMETGSEWPFKELEWCVNEGEAPVCKAGDVLPSATCNQATRYDPPSVLLWDEHSVALFHAAHLTSIEKAKRPVWSYWVERGHLVEQVACCVEFSVVLVLTRDANKWRCLNVLDMSSGAHLAQPLMVVRFSHEDDLTLHFCAAVGNALHVYIVGQGNVLGHVSLMEHGDGEHSEVRREGRISRFVPRGILPVPSCFRGYKDVLPPPPMLKQKQTLLKWSSVVSFEEVAGKLEEKLSAQESVVAVAADVHPRPREGHTEGPPAERRNTTAEKSELLRGTRYDELKSMAAKEKISFRDAVHKMRENQAMVRERGEKISEIEVKSRELQQEASNFEQLARKLKERQKNSWI
ncbi:hypothetical protein TRVL_06326 [Trypanosoma vivax]|nr:hypothetical protein TRVL_06326 [Trypanosoma vivax]